MIGAPPDEAGAEATELRDRGLSGADGLLEAVGLIDADAQSHSS